MTLTTVSRLMNMNPDAVEARARRERIIDYVARGRTITAQIVANLGAVDIQAAQRDLRALERQGRIRRIVPARGNALSWEKPS